MLPVRLEQNLTAWLSSSTTTELKLEDRYAYKALFLSQVIPDVTNPRLLPTVMISDEHADQFIRRKISKLQLSRLYQAEDQIMLGKDCFINCMKHDSADWKQANANIESIISLANNIAQSELIQAPTAYPTEEGKYQILTGHRRYFAMVFAYGIDAAAEFKVYETQPLLKKLKQFQENASREDLSPFGKLISFNQAINELESLALVRVKLGQETITVRDKAKLLGISMGAYDNYNVLTRYSAVINAYEKGLEHSFVRVKKLVLGIEQAYKTDIGQRKMNVEDRRVINKRIADALKGEKRSSVSAGRQFKIKALESSTALKVLLEKNVLELDTGIDWNMVDWDDTKAVNQTIEQLVNYLNQQHEDQH